MEKNITLSVSDAARDHLAKEGYDPKYGARPLKRLIQTTILNPVANAIIACGSTFGGTVSVDMKNGELAVVAEGKGKKGASRGMLSKKTKIGKSVEAAKRK